MLFYIIMYGMQWCALFLVGGQIYYLLFEGSSIFNTLLVFGVALFQWLIGMALDFIMGHPQPPKFLNTRRKRIIAAILSFVMGFIFSMYSNLS